MEGDRPLSDYKLFDPALLADPVDFNRRLRSEAPVYRDPATGIVLISTYELVREALNHPEIYSNRFGAALGGQRKLRPEVAKIAEQGWPPVDTMLTADPPEQKRFRSLVNKAFALRRVRALEPQMESTCNELIDRFHAEGQVELRSRFSVPLPLSIIARQLGVPREKLPIFKKWSDGFVAQLGQMATPEGEVAAAKTILEFQKYFAKTLDSRKREPKDDIISDLVHAHVDGERQLDTAESLSILQQLLVAGNETTASAITEGMWLLVRHPEQLERVRSNPDLAPNLVEEVLRLSTPTANMWRIVTQDTEIGGVELAKGTPALVRFASANRDEKVFPDPDRFDLERANAADHLAFGLGIHFCLGAQLARREMLVAFRNLTKRLSKPRLVGAEPRYMPNILLHGLDSLHLAFDRV